MDKPKTQRQLAQEEGQEEIVEYVTIKNVSKQQIPINLVAPDGVSFFAGNQSIYLRPNEVQKFPKNRLMMNEQIKNLQKKRLIKILS